MRKEWEGDVQGRLEAMEKQMSKERKEWSEESKAVRASNEEMKWVWMRQLYTSFKPTEINKKKLYCDDQSTHYTAELSISIFRSFKAGIANAISSFKWRKNKK